MKIPLHLQKLIEALKRLPGVGSKSAERYAFHLLNWPEARLHELAHLIEDIPLHLGKCDTCGALVDQSRCFFCDDPARDPSILCVVQSFKEIFSLEHTGEFRGRYHVLGGLLNPIDKRGPELLKIDTLKTRIQQTAVKELLIALDSTLEGDATALFLKRELSPYPLKISRLAFGLPLGSSLDYVDQGTLARALSCRLEF